VQTVSPSFAVDVTSPAGQAALANEMEIGPHLGWRVKRMSSIKRKTRTNKLRGMLTAFLFLAVLPFPNIMSCSDPAAPCPCPAGGVHWDKDKLNRETGEPGACVIDSDPSLSVDNCRCGRDAAGLPR